MKINKWYTISEYVDIETGEIINKLKHSKEYYTIKKTKKIEIHENYGTIKYIYECRNKGQTRIFD
jgi:hypothetical protein